jgi:hypothetical protein
MDFHEMPKSEEYSYTLRVLNWCAAGFSSLLDKPIIDVSQLNNDIQYVNANIEIWERYSSKKRKDSRYAFILEDVCKVVELCGHEKYRTAYFFGMLATMKGIRKPKLFGNEPFEISKNPKKKYDLLYHYFSEMVDLFYGVNRSPWVWSRQISGVLEDLRQATSERNLVDNLDELVRNSALLYARGQLDEAIYTAQDAHGLLDHILDPKKYPDPQFGEYRKMFTLTIEDLDEVRKLDLLNGWTFGDYPDFESLPWG